MKKNTFGFKKIKWLIILVALLSIAFVYLLIKTEDSKIIKDIKEFVSIDTKVLYISSKKEYSSYPVELFNKYEIDYLYVNSDKLNNFEKNKLERFINSKYLNNIIVIYKGGKIIDAIIDYETQDKLNAFLQKNEILPEKISNINGIVDSAKETLDDEFSLVYIPYSTKVDINDQTNTLKSICDEYNINFVRIDAFLLSYKQKEKINSIYQISSVEDQILILIKNKSILGSIRGEHRKSTYLDEFYKSKFIDEIDNYISNINYDDFKNLLNSTNKNVILIGKDDCKYCSDVIMALNPIIINYNININYLNINSLDSDIAKKVQEDISKLGYKDGFTTPITLITENNKLLDYVIGASNSEYFIDIFKENGIIKQEVES